MKRRAEEELSDPDQKEKEVFKKPKRIGPSIINQQEWLQWRWNQLLQTVDQDAANYMKELVDDLFLVLFESESNYYEKLQQKMCPGLDYKDYIQYTDRVKEIETVIRRLDCIHGWYDTPYPPPFPWPSAAERWKDKKDLLRQMFYHMNKEIYRRKQIKKMKKSLYFSYGEAQLYELGTILHVIPKEWTTFKPSTASSRIGRNIYGTNGLAPYIPYFLDLTCCLLLYLDLPPEIIHICLMFMLAEKNSSRMDMKVNHWIYDDEDSKCIEL